MTNLLYEQLMWKSGIQKNDQCVIISTAINLHPYLRPTAFLYQYHTCGARM